MKDIITFLPSVFHCLKMYWQLVFPVLEGSGNLERQTVGNIADTVGFLLQVLHLISFIESLEDLQCFSSVFFFPLTNQ